MQERIVQAVEERNALVDEVASIGRRLGAAKAEITKRQREADHAPLVEAWLSYWRSELSTAKADIAPGGDRWTRAAKALHRRIEKIRGDEPDLPADQVDQQALAELKLAVDGLKANPFYLGRNERKRRYCDVKHVLKDEAAIETFIADALGPDAPAHAAAQVVVALPVDNRVRELQAQLNAVRGDFDEAVRQLRDAERTLRELNDALMTADAHKSWLELELCRRRGADVSELEAMLIEVYGERVFRAEAAYRRAADAAYRRAA